MARWRPTARMTPPPSAVTALAHSGVGRAKSDYADRASQRMGQKQGTIRFEVVPDPLEKIPW
jgi:hypothetical protein